MTLPSLLKPSHPDHRAARKKIEAENPHFNIKELALKAGILALMAGVALAPTIEHEAEHVAAHTKDRIHETRRQREQKKKGGGEGEGNDSVREGGGGGGKRIRSDDEDEWRREKRGRGEGAGLRQKQRQRQGERDVDVEEPRRRRKEARPAPPLRVISQDFEAERQRYADRKARRMSDDDDEWDNRGRGRVHWR